MHKNCGCLTGLRIQIFSVIVAYSYSLAFTSANILPSFREEEIHPVDRNAITPDE